jgi:hypothetical protein
MTDPSPTIVARKFVHAGPDMSRQCEAYKYAATVVSKFPYTMPGFVS